MLDKNKVLIYGGHTRQQQTLSSQAIVIDTNGSFKICDNPSQLKLLNKDNQFTTLPNKDIVALITDSRGLLNFVNISLT